MAKPLEKVSSIRSKALRFMLFFAVVALALAGYSYYGMRQLDMSLQTVAVHQVAQLAAVDQLNQDLVQLRTDEKGLLLASALMDEGQLGGTATRFRESAGRLQNHLSQLEANLSNRTEVQKTGKELVAITKDLSSDLDALVTPLLAGKPFGTLDRQYRQYDQDVRDFTRQVAVLKKEFLKDIDITRQQGSLGPALVAAPGGGAVLVLLGLLFAAFALKPLTRRLAALRKAVAALGTGVFEDVQVTGKDEVAALGQVFNETLERLKGLVVTDEEREETQHNLIGFLEVVSEAADGDLTVKAPVTADAFGSIADAYNLMVDSLAELMSDTRDKAEEVGRQSRNLLEIFRIMEEGADVQTNRVQEATAAVNETSATTDAITAQATRAQDASQRVDEVTERGNELVLQNIEGMQLIRVTVQVINKKMKSLSERLLEIGTISQLISEIATRTTILAMNASIEAARAGDQGRGFLVISDEIKRLADKSAEATKQIGGVIKAIQTEAGEVTSSLEEETRTVEDQTRLAQDTGEAFSQIRQAIGVSRQEVGEIFALSQKQQNLTNQTVQSMKEVSGLSTQAMRMVKDSAHISEGLNGMSDTLLGSLSRFRLPDDDAVMPDEEFISLEEEEIDFPDEEFDSPLQEAGAQG